MTQHGDLATRPPDWNDRVRVVKGLIGRTLEDLWELGHELLRQHDVLGYGHWGPFLEEVRLSRSAAENYMRLASNFPHRGNLAAFTTLSNALSAVPLPGEHRPASDARTKAAREERHAVEAASNEAPVNRALTGPKIIDVEPLETSSQTEVTQRRWDGDVAGASDLEPQDDEGWRQAAAMLAVYPMADWAPVVVADIAQGLGCEWLADQVLRHRNAAAEQKTEQADGERCPLAVAVERLRRQGVDKRDRHGGLFWVAGERDELAPTLAGPLAPYGPWNFRESAKALKRQSGYWTSWRAA
jgi:hypothetical protein